MLKHNRRGFGLDHLPPCTPHDDRLSILRRQVQRLDRALAALEPQAAAAGVAPPAGQEWFDLLRNKLLPQLDLPPLLVVAIVGGTNIGKSVIFNHLAGEVASAVQPAGRRHEASRCASCRRTWPIRPCSQRLFEPFELCTPGSRPTIRLGDSPENRLFWRVGPTMPPRLLLLDAPDVDSDVTVNWQRARAIRQAADVLVAVLDAAEIQRRRGEAVLSRGGRGRQADRRRLQPVRAGGRPRLLAAMAGDVLRAHRRAAGIGLRGSLRSPGGRGVAAAVLRD